MPSRNGRPWGETKNIRFGLIVFHLFWCAVFAFAQMPADRKEIKKRLRSPQTSVRVEAVQSLDKLDKKIALDFAEDALGDLSWEVRRGAVLVLGRIGGREAVALLSRSLNDESLFVTGTAVRTLAGMGDPSVPERMRTLAGKGPYAGRVNALAVLGILKDPDSVDVLMGLLQDRRALVRANAVQALAPIRDPRTFEPLVRLLAGGNRRVRAAAALAMGELGDPAAAGPLSRRAGDDDPSVRAAAVSALGRLKAGGCEAALLAGLRDPSSVVQANAADALGLIGDSRHAEALARSARDEDVQVRIHAVRALGAMGTTTVLPALVEVLRDRDIQVRLESVLAIGKTGLAGPETIDPLIDALTTDWFPVRDEASMILKKITGQDLGPAVGLWRAWRAKAGMNQRD